MVRRGAISWNMSGTCQDCVHELAFSASSFFGWSVALNILVSYALWSKRWNRCYDPLIRNTAWITCKHASSTGNSKKWKTWSKLKFMQHAKIDCFNHRSSHKITKAFSNTKYGWLFQKLNTRRKKWVNCQKKPISSIKLPIPSRLLTAWLEAIRVPW